MGSLLRGLVWIVRFVLLALIVIAVWGPVTAYASGTISWDQAVDAVLTDHVVALLVAAVVLGLIASLLRAPVVRLAITVAAAVLVILMVNGTVTLDQVRDEVASYDLRNRAESFMRGCNLPLVVEETAGGVRAVLKDSDGNTISETTDPGQIDADGCEVSGEG